MNKKNNPPKKSFGTQAEELGDPRPQPQVSADDFSDEPVPQNPPPEKPSKEDDNKDGG